MVGVGREQRYIEGKYVTIAGGGDGIQRCLQDTYTKVLVIGHYFCSYFSSISDPTSLHIPYPTFLPYDYLCYVLFSLCPHSQQTTRTHSTGITSHRTTRLLDYRHPETVLLWLLLYWILCWNLLCCHQTLPPLKVPDFPDTEHE